MLYWMKQSWVQYHFSESRKLYIGRSTIEHLLYYILLCTQFINDFNCLTLRGIGLVPNGCRLLSELRRRHRNSILNRFLLKTSFHALLTFIYFCYFFILWPLSPAASSVSWYRSCLVWSGLAYEIYRGGGPSTYVYCVVCYRVIVAPYVRSVGHVFTFTLLMMIRNALWTMRLLYSSKVVLSLIVHIYSYLVFITLNVHIILLAHFYHTESL